MNKKAFSFVEIIISISILVLLAIVATSATGNIKNNSNNSRVIADLNTLKNSIISYTSEGNLLPKPAGNNNFFDVDGNYSHDYESENTFGGYGKVTNNLIPNKYLDITPLDPKTNQYYSYGISKIDNQFEVAGIIYNEKKYIAKVEGDYRAENGPYSLIREYNGPNYVIDKGFNLPYNPEERVLIATTLDGKVYSEGDRIENNTGNDLEIFFSDGSKSIISNGTNLVLTDLKFPKEDNLVSKVKLFLESGTIWTQATRLGEESNFDIFTTDITASVRGTVFKVEKTLSPNKTNVLVVQGIVDVTKRNNNPDVIMVGGFESTEVKIDLDIPKIYNSINETVVEVSSDTYEQPIFSSNQLINVVKIEDNKLVEQINEDTGDNSCYLEGTEVKNGINVNAFKQKYVDHGNSCSAPIGRKCENGILTGNNEYKYSSCDVREAGQCEPYSEEGYTGGSVTNKDDTDSVTKNEHIYSFGVTIGKKTLTKEVKCVDGINYDQIGDISTSISCSAPFTVDGETCSCPTGYNLFEGSCYENPFGDDYKLIKVVPTISGSYFWLNTDNLGESLGSNFGLVFDTIDVSQTTDESIYFYDYSGPKFLSSKNKKIRLFDKNGVVIKNSSDLNGSQNIKLKFEGNNWQEISGKLNTNGSGTPTDLNDNNNKLKLKNVKNIRVFKKDNILDDGIMVGQTYSGNGCDSCPAGSYKNGWHTEKHCYSISGDSKCAEKVWFDRDDENWSGTYTG